MNPHTNATTALAHGMLLNEISAQRETIKQLGHQIKNQKFLLLRAQEEQKRAVVQNNYTHAQLAATMRERDVAKAKLDDAQKGIDEWRKLTDSLNNDKNLLEGQLLGCREANKILRKIIETLEGQLNDEKPAPQWTVRFYCDNDELGVIIYPHAPSTSTLNMVQKSLRATSWKLTYSYE